MTGEPMGAVTMDGDRRTVRFERFYDAAPEELWGALTLPEQLARWLAPAEFEPRVGGRVVLRFEEDDIMRGTVRAYERPRLLEYDWDEGGLEESVVRFELRSEGDRTLLVLEHRQLPVEGAASFGAGWHAHLDMLEGIAGRPGYWSDRYKQLLPRYEELLGGYDPRLP
jgi:uncharacterized protein YndB with AHSA1/START domain